MAVAAAKSPQHSFSEPPLAGPSRVGVYTDFLQGAAQTTQECRAALAKINELFFCEKPPFTEYAKAVTQHCETFSKSYVTTHWLAPAQVDVPIDQKDAQQQQLSTHLKELIRFVDALAVARIAKHGASFVGQELEKRLPPRGIKNYEYLNAIQQGSGTRLNDVIERAHTAYETLQLAYSELRKAYDNAVYAMKTAGVVDQLVKNNNYLNPNTISHTAFGAPITAADQKLITDLVEGPVPEDGAEYISSLTRAILYKSETTAEMHNVYCKSLEKRFSSSKHLNIHELLTLLHYTQVNTTQKLDGEEGPKDEKSAHYTKLAKNVQNVLAAELKEVDKAKWIAVLSRVRELPSEELEKKLSEYLTGCLGEKQMASLYAYALKERGVKLEESEEKHAQGFAKAFGEKIPPMPKAKVEEGAKAGSK